MTVNVFARIESACARVVEDAFARVFPDRDFLESRWSAMLREALPPEADPPRVVLDEDPDVVAGSLAIQPVTDERPQTLALERADGARVALADGLTLGRGEDNALVVRDARASRRHARIAADGGGWVVEDAGSSNGTYVDGVRVERARLDRGQTLTIGDTSLRVVEAA
jgi:pSer/pThr/pTyr-binding forkhead associated (FHA) protein